MKKYYFNNKSTAIKKLQKSGKSRDYGTTGIKLTFKYIMSSSILIPRKCSVRQQMAQKLFLNSYQRTFFHWNILFASLRSCTIQVIFCIFFFFRFFEVLFSPFCDVFFPPSVSNSYSCPFSKNHPNIEYLTQLLSTGSTL